MGRKKDPFWDYVDRLNDKVIRCKFCGDEFAGGASRIKGHLSGMRGTGIHACTGVPEEVQKAASLTIGDSNETSCGSVNPSSNMPNDSSRGKGVLIDVDVPEYGGRATIIHPTQSTMMNVNSSSHEVLAQGYPEMNSLNFNESFIGDANSYYPEETYFISDQSVTRNINSSHDSSKEKSMTGRKKDRFWQYVETSSDGKVKCLFCGHKFKGGASRIKWHLSKTKKMGVSICSKVLKNVQEAACDSSNKRLKRNIDSSHLQENFVSNSNHPISLSKGNAKLRMQTNTYFIGEMLQCDIDELWSWLMNDEKSIIGVCGMGGVGKTTLLKHIYNMLLDESYHVIWVSTVPKDDIFHLQKTIAEQCGVHISNKDDEMETARIFDTLNKEEKCVIILDHVWNEISLEKVGIPHKKSGVKVIIATRLFDVCRTMGCQENILEVNPLYWFESSDLFFKVLEKDESQLSNEIIDIAESIIDECDGLPLAIVTMGKHMRGKEDINEWKYVLEKLRNSEKGQEDMKRSVFEELKLSHDHLNDKVLQECFLHCALSAELDINEELTKDILIVQFAMERLINEKNSLEAEFLEGLGILNKLRDSNLLFQLFQWFYIPKLVQRMALDIVRESDHYMVKTNEDLREIPAEQEWGKDLRKVYLVHIKEIPSGISPKCPRLSNLFLRSNSLKVIPNSFLINMSSLKVLNLSYCHEIKDLPTSVSNLESLTALFLHHCISLKSVPSLAKLQKLERLDLSYTAITELPLGLEKLINLRWLKLSGIEKALQVSVIPKLTNLQVLLLPVNIETGGVRADDLEGLKKLESIWANFNDTNEFNAYARGIVNARNGGIRNYFLQLMGNPCQYIPSDDVDVSVYCSDKIIKLGYIGNTNNLFLPVDMDKLFIVSVMNGDAYVMFYHLMIKTIPRPVK